MSNIAIGIDFGTAYSCVGVVHKGKVEIIANDQDERRMPNYVAFTDHGSIVGIEAKNHAAANPKSTIFVIKCLISCNSQDSIAQFGTELFPYKIIGNQYKPEIRIKSEGVKKNYSPEKISSMILTELKNKAETHLAREVRNVVITVPASFNCKQREAIKQAAQLARLNLIRLMDDSTAAAIAYGSQMNVVRQGNILISDLGGGSLSLSIVTFDRGYLHVKATGGDNHLGGKDFDNRLVDNLIQVLWKKHNIDIAKAIHRLRIACENTKRKLPISTQANLEIYSLSDDIDFCSTIGRAKFEEICADLFYASINCLENPHF